MISFSSLKTKIIYFFWATLLAFPFSSKASEGLVKQDGTPSSTLLELFQALNYPTTDIFEMNSIAQREFLRKSGKERWQMEEVPYEKQKIFPIVKKLGIINTVSPTPNPDIA